jgi:hypothetical protein
LVTKLALQVKLKLGTSPGEETRHKEELSSNDI